jgi:hypothetical protein
MKPSQNIELRIHTGVAEDIAKQDQHVSVSLPVLHYSCLTGNGTNEALRLPCRERIICACPNVRILVKQEALFCASS